MATPTLIFSKSRGESTRSVLKRCLPSTATDGSAGDFLCHLKSARFAISKCTKLTARRFRQLLANLDARLLRQSWDKTAEIFELPNPLSCQLETWEPTDKCRMDPIEGSSATWPTMKRFRVALSFPGEKRRFVKKVADHLGTAFGLERVLYDKNFGSEFARIGLNTYLPNLYREESELVCIFLCSEYWNKQWCRLEWRYIRELIETLDASRIMIFSFDGVVAKHEFGVLPGDGYIKIGEDQCRTSQEIASLIVKRWQHECQHAGIQEELSLAL